MDDYVRNILSIDSKFRETGVVDDLHLLDTINFDQSWDYSLPTLTHDSELSKLREASRSSTSFAKRFYTAYPIFSSIRMDNLLIAGGCVGNYLTSEKGRNNSSSGDVDIFIYGLNNDQANARLKEFIQDLIDQSKVSHDLKMLKAQEEAAKNGRKHYSEEHKMEFLRNKNGITINGHLQIIFRLYKTKSEILHGFDLGSSAVGFDGQNVYMTSLGKFSYEYRCNIIDTTRRSTTYEKRLEKYFNRGFDIIFPNLDITILRTNYHRYYLEEVCELPFFQFGYRKIEGNKIIFSKFYYSYYYQRDLPNSNPNQQMSTDYSLDDLDEYQAFYCNLYNLIHDRDFFFYISNVANLEILEKGPHMSWRNIQNFYDNLKTKLYTSDRLLIGTINRYFTVRNIAQISDDLFIQRHDQSKYINDLIEDQKNFAKQKMDLLMAKDHSKIPWIVDNPGTQLTSAFNPIIEDAEKWYLQYYTKTPTNISSSFPIDLGEKERVEDEGSEVVTSTSSSEYVSNYSDDEEEEIYKTSFKRDIN